MDLIFATADMETAANSSLALDKQFGSGAALVRQRLLELSAAENLAVLAEVPTLEFQSNPHHRFSISLGRFGRIDFVAAMPGIAARTLDLEAVTTIKVLAIGLNL